MEALELLGLTQMYDFEEDPVSSLKFESFEVSCRGISSSCNETLVI